MNDAARDAATLAHRAEVRAALAAALAAASRASDALAVIPAPAGAAARKPSADCVEVAR